MPIYKVDGVKKDGLQKYKVRVNYISDRDGKPKQLTRTAYGSEAAKDLERQLTEDVKNKGEKSLCKMTIQQLFDEYVTAMQFEVRASTTDKNRRNYRLYIQPTMSDVRLDRLTVPILQNWKMTIEQTNLALKTKNHAYSLFRAMMNYALRMEYIARNLLPIVGNFKDAMHTKPEMDYYTAQEFTQFITAARELAEYRQAQQNDLSEWEYYVLFNIAFYTGLRKGESYALKWSDLDVRHLSVRRSLTYKLKGGCIETPPKNKSSIRTLQMPLPLIHVLDEHIKRQKQLTHFSENYYVCGGETYLRDSTVGKRNKFYAEQAGLNSIRIHDFRHSHVSVLANEGINIQEIARRLGHARVEETWNTYSHMYPREEKKRLMS